MVAVNNSLYVLGGYNFGTLSCIEEYDMGIHRDPFLFFNFVPYKFK
jgi:hypothetical protein